MELVIPRTSYIKMIQYSRAVESEISGLANVIFDAQKHRFTLGEVYLLEQEATGGSVDLIEASVHKFLAQLIREGATQTPRAWWHSHYNFEPFFSLTDDNTIKRLRTATFIVAICVNQRGEIEAKVLISKSPEDLTVSLKVRIVPYMPSLNPTQAIKEEVALKVQQKRWPDFSRWLNGDGSRERELPVANVHYLPRSKKKRERFIRRHNLTAFYSPESEEWAYEDKYGTVYREHSNYIYGQKQ